MRPEAPRNTAHGHASTDASDANATTDTTDANEATDTSDAIVTTDTPDTHAATDPTDATAMTDAARTGDDDTLHHGMPLHPLLTLQERPAAIETSAAKIMQAPLATVFQHFWGSQPELRLDLHKDHVKAYHIEHETADTLEYEYVFEAYGSRNWGRAVEVARRPDRIDVEVTDGPLVGQTVTTLFEPVGQHATKVTQINRVWPGRSDMLVKLMGKTLRSRLVALAGVHLEQHRRDIEGEERFQDRFSKEHQAKLAKNKRGAVADFVVTTRAITLPIILLPLLAAAAVASTQGMFSPLALVLTLVGGGAAQLGANVLNDLWDFRGGADVSARTIPGAIETGSGAFVEGRWSLRKGWTVTATLFTVALAAGVALAVLSTPLVLLFAAAGAAISYVYIGPPFPLAYKGRGLGEITIFIAFGILPVLGGVLAHGGTTSALDATAWWTAMVFGLASSIVLYHHHFLHWMADKAAGKGSPVALLGPNVGAVAGALLAVATSAAIIAAVVVGPLPTWTALAALPPMLVLRPARFVAAGDDSPPARQRLAGAGFFGAVLTGIVFVVTLWTA
jgi:1,4-dihydroxy-2-naphthoate octaprenyltransferase